MYQYFIDFVRETFDDPEGFIILHDPRFVGNERKYIMDAMDLDISVITTHLS